MNTNFLADADNNVRALVKDGSTLYLGGDFIRLTNYVGGTTNTSNYNRIVPVDAVTGTGLLYSNQLDAVVRAMALSGTNLFIAGDFVRITNGVVTNGVSGVNVATNTRNRIAALSTANGLLITNWNPNADSNIIGLWLDNTNLYVGGNFGNISGQARRRVARLNTDTTVTNMVDSFNPQPGGQVQTIAAQNGRVFIGGDFNFVNGAVRNRLIAIDAASGAILPWNPNADSTVFALTAANAGGSNVVFAGGNFQNIAGAARRRLVQLSTNVQETNSTNLVIASFTNAFDNIVRALAVGAGNLYVGGDFIRITNAPDTSTSRTGLVAVDLISGALNAGFTANAVQTGGSNVLALAYNGSSLFVGGTFTNIGGQTRFSLASVDPTTGVVNPAFTNDFNGPVLSLLPSDANLQVAGNFTTNTNALVTTFRPNFASVDTLTGTNKPSFQPSAGARIFAMANIGTNLYFGGAFTTVTNSGTTTGSTRNRLAEFSTTTGAVTPWNPNVDSEVYALYVSGNRLYVGGAFSLFQNTTQGMLRQGLGVLESNSLPAIVTTPGAMTYTLNDPATPVDPGVILRDADTEFITNAVVSITGSYLSSEDVLALPANNYGVTGSFNPGNGVLTLSGFASVANYQSALRLVTYVNTSGTPNLSMRTVTFALSDYLYLPVSATRNIELTLANAAPTLNPIDSLFIYEDQPVTVDLGGITSGGGSQLLTVTATSTDPTVIAPTVTYTSPNTTGLVNITSVTNGNGFVTISVVVRDNGGTGNGGVDAVTNTFEVVVFPVNDAPTITPLANLTINADSGSRNLVLANITPGGGVDEAAQMLSVSVASSDTSVIPAPSIIYSYPDSTGLVSFAVSPGAIGTATISVVVQDDGGTSDGGVDTVTNSFTVAVVPNAPPTLNALANIVTNASPGAFTNLILSGISAGLGGAGQSLIVTTGSSDTNLIPVPVVIYTNGNATGVLQFTPVPAAAGTATISVTIQDDGGTTVGGVDTLTRTFTVTLATNAAPTLNALTDLTLNEDPGTINVSLSGISRGMNAQLGFTEGSQVITITASSSNPLLISPAVTYTSANTTGTLNVTPRPNAAGTATVSVVVSDNGGRALGGLDSVTNTFVVTVFANGLNDLARTDFLINNGQINTILETNGTLFVGGTFTEFGTNTGKGLIVDSTNGNAAGRFPVFPLDINAMVADGSGGWYVGGNFPNVDGRPFARLVHILSDRTIDPNFSANLDAAANALLLSGDKLYVGGSFVRVTNVVNGVNVATNSRWSLAVLNPTNGAVLSLGSQPAFDSSISSLALNGTTLYVGGAFVRVTNIIAGPNTNITSRFRVAALDATSGQPTAFQADLDQATTRALAVSGDGTILYMGGDFISITNSGNTYASYRFAAVDANTGVPITGYQADLSARARAIVVSGNQVIVGGDFTAVTNSDGVANRYRIVAVDGGNGQANANWIPRFDNLVLALALDGTNLYAGGTFVTVTNQSGGAAVTRRRAALLGANLSAPASIAAFNPDAGNQVNAIAPNNGAVFVGGTFNYVKPLFRNRLAALDVASGQLLPWNPNANNTIFTLAMANVGGSNVLYAGGQFTTIAAQNRFRLVQLSTNVAETVSTNLIVPAFSNAFDNIIRALAVGPTNLYVGGDFIRITNAPGVPTSQTGLVAVDLTNGALNTNFVVNAITNSPAAGTTNIAALLLNGGSLFVGGGFSNIGGLTRYSLASLDANSGAVNTNFLANFGSNSTNSNGANVLALALNGTNLYVGGTFTTVSNVFVSTNGIVSTNGTNRSRLVSLDPVNGSLITNFIANANNPVWALAINGTNLYAGGVFTSVTNTAATTRDRLAEFQITNGVVGGFNPDFNDIVSAVHVSGGRLFVGGLFTTLGSSLTLRPGQGLAVFGGNEAPVATATGTALQYIMGSGTAAVDPGLLVSDRNNFTFPAAAVSITSGYVAGEDVLGFTAQNGITGTFDSASGVLTLIGTAPVADYQAALRSVTYNNTAGGAGSTATRTVQFSITDGSAPTPTTVTRQITPITGGNSAPTLAAISDLTILEDAAQQTVPLSGISSGGDAGQVLTVSASSSSTALIAVSSTYNSPDTTGSLTLTPALNANGTATITVIVHDDGGTSGTGVDSVTNTFAVTVTAVNDAPTLGALGSLTINEDVSLQTLTLTGVTAGPSNESGQTVTVSAISSSPTVIPNPTVSYTSGITGTLQFTPVLNANGVVTISVVAQDNGGTTSGGVDVVTNTFVVTVTAVNDAPTLGAITGVTNFVNVGALTVNLSGISAGPANESTQGLSVNAQSSNTGLIPNPTVTYNSPNSTGSLVFTPVTNATGSATVSVVVQDDGGTANGGISAVTNTFIVTIHPNSVRTLTVTRIGTNTVVSWPTLADGFILQTATNLTASGPSAWSNNTNAPVQSGSQFMVTNNLFTTNRVFFRLIKP